MSQHDRPRRRTADFLAGGGEMGERMRGFDWQMTPLGRPESWPQSLKTAVRIMLTSRQPIWIGWGKELTYLYNDPYKSIIGGKHPWALGRPTSVVWKEIWNDIGPMLDTAMTGIEGTYVEAQLLIMERNGYPEETYYTFSYSPIPNDDGSAGGIICANSEDTQRVIGERQLALLRELAARTADARTVDEVCRLGASALETNPHDLPFALIYLADPDKRHVVLAGASGIAASHSAAPGTATLDDDDAIWPFAEVVRTNAPHVVSNLDGLPDALPKGAWDRPTAQVVAVPIARQGETGRAGVLVAGLNPYRLFDDGYRGFLGLVAGQIAAGIANAQAYEQERRRAEALAEIDRTKTAFFSNVSHEFRTPLTLMLGPLEDLLHKPEGQVTPDNRALVTVAHRNGLRLLKLVNALLDFSRIEAGRVQALYEPTDLAAFTAELASVFQSAVDKAGLTLTVDCPALAEPVYVDRDMWEKIVLNLISNAFKFTLEGGIAVSLRHEGDAAALLVRDTGSGIPEHEIPRLFDRFHRVEGARGRTHEGTGIGLALVQELVKLHGGTVRAESVEGSGSTFVVTVPVGTAHLPPDRIRAASTLASAARGADPYVEEALRWLPENGDAGKEPGIERALLPEQPLSAPASAEAGERATILLADDNADMRNYVRRLLSARYEVRTVADGEAALAALREQPPDLLLSDVMMPRLDGFGLVRQIRADPALADLPIVLLSARAGEEASIQGLEAGADDYLVKPFSARELSARIAANLEMARLRTHRKRAEESARAAEERLRAALVASGTGTFRWDIRTNAVEVDASVNRLFGLAPTRTVRHLDEFLPLIDPEDRPGMIDRCERCAREGADFEMEFRIVWPGGSRRWIYDRGKTFRDAEGRPAYLTGACVDITERKHADEALRKTQAQLQAIVNDAPLGVYLIDSDFRIRQVNPTALPVFGNISDLIGRDFDEVIHIMWPKAYADEIVRRFRHTLDTGEPYIVPERIEERLDLGVTEYYAWQINRIPLPEGRYGVACYFRDISFSVFARQTILASEERLRFMAESMPQKIFTATPAGDVDYFNRQWIDFSGLVFEAKDWNWTQFTHPDDVAENVRLWQHSIETGEPFQFMHRFRRADGTYRWHLSRAHAMRDAGGKIVMWIGSSTDVHEQKETEEAYRELSDTLERQVAERTHALEVEMHERQKVEVVLQQAQRLEAIGQLTGGVAHDFNNLLTVVIGQAESIVMAAEAANGSERIMRMASAIQHVAERGAQLTSQLLAFSRRQRLRPEPVVVRRLMATIGDLVRRAVGEAITVEIAADPKLWSSLIDVAQFEAAILNLAVNARDAMPNGGRLTVEARNAVVAEAEARGFDLAPGDYVVVRVSDTGCGMSPEVQRRCFEPFFTTKDVGKGTGLGLSQIYGFARQSGGTATVDSAVGCGTTISLYLPRAEAAAIEEASSPIESKAAVGRGKTVLVVEDQADVREIIEGSLGQLGYRVLTAPDGVEARQVLESSEPVDLLLTDVVMPNGVNGVELARWARRLRQDLKIVLVSGYSRQIQLQDGDREFGFLEKPFRQAELASAIAAALGAKQTAE